MTRTISATNVTSSQQEIARPALFAKIEFESATIYVSNAPKNIDFGGNTYTGVGAFGSVSQTQEGAELQSYSIDLTLTGVDSSLLSEALGTGYKNRDCTVYLGFFNENHVLVDDPFVLFKGRMDTMPIELGESGVIVLTVESRLADWERPRIRRYTDADQKATYPNDKGFEFVDQMIEKVLVWGRG